MLSNKNIHVIMKNGIKAKQSNGRSLSKRQKDSGQRKDPDPKGDQHLHQKIKIHWIFGSKETLPSEFRGQISRESIEKGNEIMGFTPKPQRLHKTQ